MAVCRGVFFLTAVSLWFSTGVVLAEDAPCPDSLRLGARYLRWEPANANSRADAPPALSGTETPSTPPPLSGGMSLSEWERIAEQNNPALQQAAARVEAARAQWVQAGLRPNPRLGYQGTEIGDERKAGQQGAFVGQEFITAGKLQRSRDVACHAVRQAEFVWAAQRQRVLNDVRRAFFDVLVAQRTVELTDRLVHIGQEGVRTAESLFEAQEVSRVDVLQSRIEAESARILADKSRHRLSAAWRNLAIVAGVPNMLIVPVSGDLQDGLARLTWEDALAQLWRENPLLAEVRAGVARAEAALSREYAERVPNFDLEASVQYDNATRDPIAGVQAGMPLPVFNRNQGNIRRAQAELTAARSEVQRTTLELQRQLAVVFEQYENARCQVEKYAGEILPNAQKSLELVAAGYRQGEFGYTTLLMAQRTFFQANLAYVEALRDLRASTIAIEGQLLIDSLQSRY